MCTVQSGKKDAHRAVDEAKYILTAVEATPLLRRATAAAAAAVKEKQKRKVKDETPSPADHKPSDSDFLFGDSLPLHIKGELGCTFLPLNMDDLNVAGEDEEEFAKSLKSPSPILPSVVKYGVDAIENFCSEPLPPGDTPEYLARLVPVERTCPATVKEIVDVLHDEILPQHFSTRQAYPPRTYYDEYKSPTTFAIHYEHHGKSEIDRAELMMRVGELLPSPDFKVDLHDQEHTIFVIVYHEVALVSVLPRWHVMQHYNVHELLGEKLRAQEGVQTTVQTTGGGGYP